MAQRGDAAVPVQLPEEAAVPDEGQQAADEPRRRLTFLPRERKLPRFSGGAQDVLSAEEFAAEVGRVIQRVDVTVAAAAEAVI